MLCLAKDLDQSLHSHGLKTKIDENNIMINSSIRSLILEKVTKDAKLLKLIFRSLSREHFHIYQLCIFVCLCIKMSNYNLFKKIFFYLKSVIFRFVQKPVLYDIHYWRSLIFCWEMGKQGATMHTHYLFNMFRHIMSRCTLHSSWHRFKECTKN